MIEQDKLDNTRNAKADIQAKLNKLRDKSHDVAKLNLEREGLIKEKRDIENSNNDLTNEAKELVNLHRHLPTLSWSADCDCVTGRTARPSASTNF